MNNTCRECGEIDSYKRKKKLMMEFVVCKSCNDTMTPEEYNNYKNTANPRCPNVECDFHKHTPPAKKAFVISVVEEGIMGKIFKSEAYGIISCKKCGEIIGVGCKG
jgi:formylmethanofuran dehydrogenase subunit E